MLFVVATLKMTTKKFCHFNWKYENIYVYRKFAQHLNTFRWGLQAGCIYLYNLGICRLLLIYRRLQIIVSMHYVN